MDKIKRLFREKKSCRNTNLDKAIAVLKNKNYKLIRKIGSGSFGYVVALMTPNKTEMAAKIVSQGMTSLGEFTEWHKFRHPNILPMLEIIRQPDYNVILMPLHQKSLAQTLEDLEFQNNSRSFKISKGWLKNILNGLHYLHCLNICHLDLEAENIMITFEMVATLGDFTYISKNTEGVRRYGLKSYNRPPEAGNRNGHCPEVDGTSFDIWSFGMLSLKVWNKKLLKDKPDQRCCWNNDVYPLLFESLQFPAFCKLINQNFPQESLNKVEIDQVLNLVKGTLRYQPKHRPCTSVIQLHSLLSENHEQSLLLKPDLMWMRLQTVSGSFQEHSSPEVEIGDLSSHYGLQLHSQTSVEERLEDICLKNDAFETSVKTTNNHVEKIAESRSCVLNDVNMCTQEIVAYVEEQYNSPFFTTISQTPNEVHFCLQDIIAIVETQEDSACCENRSQTSDDVQACLQDIISSIETQVETSSTLFIESSPASNDVQDSFQDITRTIETHGDTS